MTETAEITSISDLMQKYWFVLATGKESMINRYAQGYGAGVHSVDADNINREPVTETPEEAAAHKVITILRYASALSPQIQDKQGVFILRQLACLGADVETEVGKIDPDTGEIFWEKLYKASRDHDITNLDDVQDIKSQAHDYFEEPFLVRWKLAIKIAFEKDLPYGGEGLSRMLSIGAIGYFQDGIDADHIDEVLANDLDGVFNRGSRLDLTDESRRLNVPVWVETGTVQDDIPENRQAISYDFLHMMMVDRYIPPQVLLAVINQDMEHCNISELMPEVNSPAQSSNQ